MELFDFSLFVELLFGVPFSLACAGVVIAVVGKAAGRFPYQPDEERAFGRPLLPRWYSKIYAAEPPPRPEGSVSCKPYENPDPQRPRRHRRGRL